MALETFLKEIVLCTVPICVWKLLVGKRFVVAGTIVSKLYKKLY
jgi:hypothetical protein